MLKVSYETSHLLPPSRNSYTVKVDSGFKTTKWVSSWTTSTTLRENQTGSQAVRCPRSALPRSGRRPIAIFHSQFLEKIDEKRIVSERNVDSERSGEGSSGIPSQDSQDLSAAAAAASLITEKSSETHSVDGQSLLESFSPCFTLHDTQQDFTLDIHV
jgi:hypothetical protein